MRLLICCTNGELPPVAVATLVATLVADDFVGVIDADAVVVGDVVDGAVICPVPWLVGPGAVCT